MNRIAVAQELVKLARELVGYVPRRALMTIAVDVVILMVHGMSIKKAFVAVGHTEIYEHMRDADLPNDFGRLKYGPQTEAMMNAIEKAQNRFREDMKRRIEKAEKEGTTDVQDLVRQYWNL